MTNEPNFIAGRESEGKVGALIAWALFILSIPSANVLVLVGLVVSYVTRGTATGVARQHIDAQIALFWSVFWWTIAAWVGIAISAVASVVLIGIPFLLLFLLAWFLLSVWFTIKSVIGLLNLLNNKPI
ncbi:hypothetical protein EGY25_02030 [Brevundimonas intermedia]|uniref:DUF4870 domain-containing protein n=1 Tax=Brevundimonas intermedia TaxID=74315 RepID=A0A4Y9S0K7_9CAUL|nr:hypothetical protein [Brevundimonas intermedia]TFW14011.1 hypothetical protein EGY25_02030 [Brevundimonas intermedia]